MSWFESYMKSSTHWGLARLPNVSTLHGLHIIRIANALFVVQVHRNFRSEMYSKCQLRSSRGSTLAVLQKDQRRGRSILGSKF